MAQMLRLRPPTQTPANAHRRRNSSSPRSEFTRYHLPTSTQSSEVNHSWTNLTHNLKCRGRFSCLFSDNRKEDIHFDVISSIYSALLSLGFNLEQARKALENALGGKKTDFEKWDKEIKRREEAGGGGNSGGGGWFRWFGGSGDGDHFWQEAKQASLTILGIIAMYLIVAKGDVMLAVIFNPLLYTLRGARNGLRFITAQVMNKVSPTPQANFDSTPKYEAPAHTSAKESALRKWGSD
nr:uncharacterized protein LOC109165023 [Ipomoea batatas]